MKPVIRKKGETTEQLIKRFERIVKKEGIIFECKKHAAYIKPGEIRRLKHRAALKRRIGQSRH